MGRMRLRSTLLAVLGGLLLSCGRKEAPLETLRGYSETSYSIASPIPYRYSVYRDDENGDASTVLYYFHGTGGDEHTWLQSHRAMIERWRIQGKPIPVVVAVTLGPRRMLFPRSGGKNSGCLEYFVDEIMPRVEGGLGTPVKRRYAFGFSMGGQNAAQLVFRFPKLFERAAIVSPSIYPVSPYDGKAAIDAFIERTKEMIPGSKDLLRLFFHKGDRIGLNIWLFLEAQKSYFSDRQAWEKAVITRNIADPPEGATRDVYISCSDRDEMGFYFGTTELARAAAARSYRVVSEVLAGGHMSMNGDRIADFLSASGGGLQR
jgi:pimeloyl-ACP methyl ester carboxylesterase